MDRLIKYLREHLQTLQLYSEKGQRIDSEHQTRRQDDRSPTKINPQRERGNENRAVSGSSVQVDEAEKTRKQIELGINPDGPKKGSAGRIFLLMITLVIASGGSWFAWIQYQEQVDATNITLAPAEQAAADAEAKPRAEVNSERPTEAEPATQVVVDADAKAKLAADAEAKLVADAEAKLVADAEAKLVADAEAKLKADAEAARQAKIDAEAQRRSVAEAERKVDATSLLREGVSLAAFGDYAAAIENYNEAIRLNVQPGFAHKQRGAAHHALGNYQAAIADYSETIRLSPGDANAFYSRSASYFAMQNFEAVISDCDEAIRIEPEYGGAYSNRAAAYEALGNLDAAERDRAAAVEIRSKR